MKQKLTKQNFSPSMTIQIWFLIQVSSLLQLKFLQGKIYFLSPHFSWPVSCLWHCESPDPYLHSCWLRHPDLCSDLPFIISALKIFIFILDKFSCITSKLICGSSTGLSSWFTLVHHIHLITRLRNQITWILLTLLHWWHGIGFYFHYHPHEQENIRLPFNISSWMETETWQNRSDFNYAKNFSILDPCKHQR